jgi:hypothetical protein
MQAHAIDIRCTLGSSALRVRADGLVIAPAAWVSLPNPTPWNGLATIDAARFAGMKGRPRTTPP